MNVPFPLPTHIQILFYSYKFQQILLILPLSLRSAFASPFSPIQNLTYQVFLTLNKLNFYYIFLTNHISPFFFFSFLIIINISPKKFLKFPLNFSILSFNFLRTSRLPGNRRFLQYILYPVVLLQFPFHEFMCRNTWFQFGYDFRW